MLGHWPGTSEGRSHPYSSVEHRNSVDFHQPPQLLCLEDPVSPFLQDTASIYCVKVAEKMTGVSKSAVSVRKFFWQDCAGADCAGHAFARV
jgi:hypothetical protein